MITFDHKKKYHVVPAHAPGAELDYGFVMTSWLEPGETIAEEDIVWTIETSTTDITLSRQQFASNIMSVFVTGGVLDCDYIIKATFTTSEDRTDSRIIELRCRLR